MPLAKWIYNQPLNDNIDAVPCCAANHLEHPLGINHNNGIPLGSPISENETGKPVRGHFGNFELNFRRAK